MESYRPNRRIEGPFDGSVSAECLNGTFVGLEREGVVSFRGIPFAVPPVGALRWKEPVPVTASDGVFEAVCNGPSPIQTKLDSERASFWEQSEDCLYLNVWTAEGYAGQKRAVMVFIHGGSYGWGGTADPLYDGHSFVKAHPEIVLVTIAYRTGLAGFMDFSEVPGGEAYAQSGNLGLLDQICALRYIQGNIRSFGGDPSNVTVFGESAGGGSVSLLPLIPAARGLFSRVIAESGSVALTYSRKECLPLTRMLMKETGARRMEDLAALSPEEFRAVNEKLNQYNNFPERDGVVLPEDLYGAYERGEAAPVEMMIGTNADELRYWILDLGGVRQYRLMSGVMLRNTLKQISRRDRKRVEAFLLIQPGTDPADRPWKITELYNELLFRLPAIRQGQAHAERGNPVYMYYWRYPSSLPDLLACHAVELAYIFNNLDETIYTGEGIDRKLAEEAQKMWVNFALTGNPSTEEHPWEPYSVRSRKTMVLDGEIFQKINLHETGRRLLFPLLEYRFNGNYTAVTESAPKIAAIAAAAAAGAGLAGLLLWSLLKKGKDDG
ncbi:MAG: carboxylesterase/lipase family protein [Clostridia bacterium]|nr:carboxylesterase/lipase family protein [Clostridia bacterium]